VLKWRGARTIVVSSHHRLKTLREEPARTDKSTGDDCGALEM
jgi:hypothetical protein